jgi:hypothetical protein
LAEPARPPQQTVPIAPVLICTLVLFLLAPQWFFGGGNIGERLLIPVLAVTMIAYPPGRRLTNVLALLAGFCLPVYLAFFTSYSNVGTQPGGGWHARYFTHRPYEFSQHAAFLEHPELTALPAFGFRTSLLQPVDVGCPPARCRK